MSEVFCAKWLNPRWQNTRCCHHQVESEWMSEVFFLQMLETNLGKCEWVWEEKLRWLNPRCQIQDGRIPDGCHHQVKWEWMSLSQIELVWVRVRMEWECFWVNLREDNKVSESKMAVSESNIAEFKMAIHHQVESEWMSEVFFFCKMAESMMAEFKMAAIIKLESEWMSLSQIELVWVRVLCKMAESKMAELKMEEFKMFAIIKLIRWN